MSRKMLKRAEVVELLKDGCHLFEAPTDLNKYITVRRAKEGRIGHCHPKTFEWLKSEGLIEYLGCTSDGFSLARPEWRWKEIKSKGVNKDD